MLPGLIAPHTHMVYEGSRELDIEMRAKGTGYKEVLGFGGGIMSTLRETRTASSDKLMKNAAKAVEKQDLLGSIEPGKQADLVIFDVPNHRQIPYWLGENRVETVVCSGRIVWDRNQPAK